MFYLSLVGEETISYALFNTDNLTIYCGQFPLLEFFEHLVHLRKKLEFVITPFACRKIICLGNLLDPPREVIPLHRSYFDWAQGEGIFIDSGTDLNLKNLHTGPGNKTDPDIFACIAAVTGYLCNINEDIDIKRASIRIKFTEMQAPFLLDHGPKCRIASELEKLIKQHALTRAGRKLIGTTIRSPEADKKILSGRLILLEKYSEFTEQEMKQVHEWVKPSDKLDAVIEYLMASNFLHAERLSETDAIKTYSLLWELNRTLVSSRTLFKFWRTKSMPTFSKFSPEAVLPLSKFLDNIFTTDESQYTHIDSFGSLGLKSREMIVFQVIYGISENWDPKLSFYRSTLSHDLDETIHLLSDLLTGYENSTQDKKGKIGFKAKTGFFLSVPVGKSKHFVPEGYKLSHTGKRDAIVTDSLAILNERILAMRKLIYARLFEQLFNVASYARSFMEHLLLLRYSLSCVDIVNMYYSFLSCSPLSSCRPTFEPNTSTLVLENARNPLSPLEFPVSFGMRGIQSVYILGDRGSGKTTLMKALQVNVILAHIGCFVFADNMTVGDFRGMASFHGLSERFSRENQCEDSSFFLEMTRLKSILSHPPNFIVFIDDLGSTTSSSESLALNKATSHALKRRGIFSIISSSQLIGGYEGTETKYLRRFPDRVELSPILITSNLCYVDAELNKVQKIEGNKVTLRTAQYLTTHFNNYIHKLKYVEKILLYRQIASILNRLSDFRKKLEAQL